MGQGGRGSGQPPPQAGNVLAWALANDEARKARAGDCAAVPPRTRWHTQSGEEAQGPHFLGQGGGVLLQVQSEQVLI